MSTLDETKNNEDIIFDCNIPQIDLSLQKEKQFLVDKENNQYLGHPDSVLLDDGSIYVFYPKGHGKGSIIMKRSVDGGQNWSERLETPVSWQESQETPTIYTLEMSNGTKRLLLISGLPDMPGGFKTSFSDDNGLNFSEFKHFFAHKGFEGLVALASLTRLKKPNGDFDDKWLGLFHDKSFNNWKTYLTFDELGNEVWSYPERLLQDYDTIEKYAQLCEIEIIRSPKGNQLALIARAQSKKTNAMIAFSNDEGITWTPPRELPASLMGERHKATYDPISGRLLITFREIIRRNKDDLNDWIATDWVAWVGTYEDLVDNKEGQYKVRLLKDYTPSQRGGDCGYAGNVVLQDGTFVLTSYGHWTNNHNFPYIMTVRFKLKDLDATVSPLS